MTQAYKEMSRVIKPDGEIAVVIGVATINGKKIIQHRNVLRPLMNSDLNYYTTYCYNNKYIKE